jgi:hypothetical protein
MGTMPDTENAHDVGLGTKDEAAERIRAFNERLIHSSKTAGVGMLDAYEKALNGLIDFEEKVSGASQLEWVSALTQTHVSFVRDANEAYTKAARELLS